MNPSFENIYFLTNVLLDKVAEYFFTIQNFNTHIIKHTYFSLFYQIKNPISAIKFPISMSDDKDLTGYIVSGLSILYKDVSTLFVYPVFTLLFFAVLAIVIVLAGLTVKKYIQCEMLLSAKLLVLTILSSLALIDIYLIAFGKMDVLILFLKVQKDLFFILAACFVGLWAGRIYFKGSSSDEVVP